MLTMSEEQKLAVETAPDNKEGKKESSSLLAGKGKIFLLIGIVLVQAVAAYAVVSGYYPDIKDFTSQFQTSGGVYYQIENIIINPAQSNGERYLILSLTVELDDGSALGTLERKNAEVQDRINTTVSNFNSRELSKLEYRDTVKKQLGIVINEVIGKKSVRNLFFTKYVLQ